MQDKQYDAAYFQQWYRERGIGGARRLARKVALAVATAEYHLERPIRSVLDVGAGEALWRAPLLKLRPNLRYLAFDSSHYAVARHGARRNLHFARFADFRLLRPCPPVDLLVCSDVLHYLSSKELEQGLEGLADLCDGIAFLETFTAADATEGDLDGFQRRSAAFYRQRFRQVGFRALGSHCWLSPRQAAQASALELG